MSNFYFSTFSLLFLWNSHQRTQFLKIEGLILQHKQRSFLNYPKIFSKIRSNISSKSTTNSSKLLTNSNSKSIMMMV